MCKPLPKQALVISYHNWRSRRLGGFHKFAEALCEAGYDVGFVSYPRPWYGVVGRSEIHSLKTMLTLLGGVDYQVAGRQLCNFTSPTLAIPPPVRKLVPGPINEFFDTHTCPDLVKRCRRRYPDARVIVLESTIAGYLVPALRRAYKNSKIVYRPSDPLVGDPKCTTPLAAMEREVLETVDLVLMVNEESRQLYAKCFTGLDMHGPRMQVLPNGVDLEPFRQEYARPEFFGPGPVALYVGVLNPHWECLLAAAVRTPEVSFCIVTPQRPPAAINRQIQTTNNLTYYPGVPPEMVPALVVNCQVMAIAYPEGIWQLRPWGLHAKLLQGMAAQKPIICRHLSPEMEDYGIVVTGNDEEFATRIKAAATGGNTTYSFDLTGREWRRIKDHFVELVTTA